MFFWVSSESDQIEISHEWAFPRIYQMGHIVTVLCQCFRSPRCILSPPVAARLLVFSAGVELGKRR